MDTTALIQRLGQMTDERRHLERMMMLLEEVTAQRDLLLAACESLIANLPDEIFEWIGDSISWSNVSAIKNARQAAEDAIAAVIKED